MGPSKRDRTLVTGGATGIGRATVRRLAKRGDEVGIHFHGHAREAQELVDALRGAGGTAWSVGADLREKADVERLVSEVEGHFEAIENLVLNAGEYPRRTLEDLSEEDFEATLRLNLLAPFALTRRLRERLRAVPRPPARVVIVSSVLAFQGSPHGIDYAASKAGVLGLARSLSRALAPDITVNVVAPGSIDTAILAHDTPEQRAARGRAIPLGRIGAPEEVAEAIAFLTSPAASYMTGTTLHVNGGLRMD